MSREKSLIKNIVIYGVGNFGAKFLSFLLLPFYTFYLSTNEYGYFDLITNTLILLTPLITLQSFDGLYRYLLDANDEDEKAQIITSSFSIILKNLIIINLVYFIITFFVDIKFKYLIILQMDFSIIAGMWMQITRGLKENVKYSISGIIMTLATLVSNIILVAFFKFRVDGLIISIILAALITVIYIEISLKIRRYLHVKNNSHTYIKSIISFSIPLIPNNLSWWFMNVSDRYILSYYIGMDANGIYAVANRFPAIIYLVNSIFYLAWQESSISEYNSTDRDTFYTKIFDHFMTIQFTVVLVLLAFTKLLMSFMVNIKFGSAWQYVPFLYFGAVFSAFSSFYGTGYLSSKDTKGAFTTSIYGAVLNVAINLLAIPYIGIQSASLATMLAFLFMWVLRIIQTKKYFNIRINKVKLGILIAISLVFLYIYYSNSLYLQVLAMLLSLGIFVVFNKDLILKMINYVILGCRGSLIKRKI